MVQEILRERDHGGFSERSDFGSRMGGGMDVSVSVYESECERLEVGLVVLIQVLKMYVSHSDPCTKTLGRCDHRAQWRDDQENPE